MRGRYVTNRVRVPERGHTDIDPETWRALSGQPSFWRLVQQGVVGISLPQRGRVRLDGKCYVGRARVGESTVELVDKVPGALAALLGFATHRAFRLEEMEAPSTELGELARLLVHQFLESLRAYVSRGRDFQYVRRGSIGSLVGGRIDLTRTLRLRARGLRHLVAFDRSFVARNTPKNRVLLAAVREIERISALIELSHNDVASARGLALLFSDCRDPEVLFGKRERLVQYAERLAVDRRETLHQDLLTLAAVILSHESFEPEGPVAGVVPRAWFLNLETLFETAVRRVLRLLVPDGVTVVSGTRQPPRIFEREQRVYRAKPDLVLRSEVLVAAVGDVKYKQWSGSADEADLYQLLVHAATYKADRCFLVFPHDSFEVRDLGLSSTGCRTWLFAVDVRTLVEGLRSALAAMELPSTVAEAA